MCDYYDEERRERVISQGIFYQGIPIHIPSHIAHFIPFDEGKVWVRPDYAEVFQTQGLTTFASIMAYSSGQRYKKNKYREVLRFELLRGKGLFLKRHFHARLRDSVRSWFSWKSPKTFAYQEIESIGHLQQVGIRTMEPVAFGERTGLVFQGPSFLITEEVENAVKLEKYLTEKETQWQKDFAFRTQLIEKLAWIARTMHENNLHHQDFYLGHILLSYKPHSLDFFLTLIDLQRVHKRHPLHQRWKIKDIAQITYSASQALVNATDYLRFYLHYRHQSRFTKVDRLWLQAIRKKYSKIKKHDTRSKLRKKRKESKTNESPQK